MSRTSILPMRSNGRVILSLNEPCQRFNQNHTCFSDPNRQPRAVASCRILIFTRLCNERTKSRFHGAHHATKDSTSAWCLRKPRQKAGFVEVPSCNTPRLRAALPSIRRLRRKESDTPCVSVFHQACY